MKTVRRTKISTIRKPFPRLVRSEAYETSRPNAGGFGIGCPTRMTGGILPAPPRRRTSPCASEGGNLAARPRGRAAVRRSCHVFAGALTSSRLWDPTRTVRRHPSTPRCQSRLPVCAPASFPVPIKIIVRVIGVPTDSQTEFPVSPQSPRRRVGQIGGAVEVWLWCGRPGRLDSDASWQHPQFDPLARQPFPPGLNLDLKSQPEFSPEPFWAGEDWDYDYNYD